MVKPRLVERLTQSVPVCNITNTPEDNTITAHLQTEHAPVVQRISKVHSVWAQLQRTDLTLLTTKQILR